MPLLAGSRSCRAPAVRLPKRNFGSTGRRGGGWSSSGSGPQLSAHACGVPVPRQRMRPAGRATAPRVVPDEAGARSSWDARGDHPQPEAPTAGTTAAVHTVMASLCAGRGTRTGIESRAVS